MRHQKYKFSSAINQMKMKTKSKIGMLVLLAFLLQMTANAQKESTPKAPKTTTATDAKPTKQETMDWIVGKMKENLPDGRKFVSYNNGIVVTNTVSYGITLTLSIDLNQVTGVLNQYSSDYIVTGKNLCSLERSDYAGKLQYGQSLYISGPNYEDRDVAFNFTPDQSLAERLKKAFTTLIDYNSTRKTAEEKF